MRRRELVSSTSNHCTAVALTLPLILAVLHNEHAPGTAHAVHELKQFHKYKVAQLT